MRQVKTCSTRDTETTGLWRALFVFQKKKIQHATSTDGEEQARC
jgi:hypothetical protein